MYGERKPTILLVSNPQTSKNEALPKNNLLSVPSFRNIVDQFDRALGLPPQGSLHPDKQIASVVMSVAAHTAFVEGLTNKTQPGLLDPRNRRFNSVFTGHSVGEMASLIEAGVCDIPTMAWMLNERERITKNPLQAGIRRDVQQPLEGAVRRMLAIVGAHPDQVETYLGQLGEKLPGPVKLFLANRNTDKQTVVALEVLEEHAENLMDNMSKIISELIDPYTSQPVFGRIRLHDLGLPNAFHTMIMQYEESLYITAIEKRLTEENFTPPQDRTVYSPTFPGWLSSLSLDPTYSVVKHILTKPVRFIEGTAEWNRIPNLVAAVTADVKKTAPNLLRDNGMKVPLLNIVDKESLEEAIDTAAEHVQLAA